jgi:AcrR family transcriptional regulator
MRVVAGRGSAATSLRAIADAAEVSPALVNHHFGSREALLDHVDREAIEVFARAYADTPPDLSPTELLRRRSEQTQAVMRDDPEVCGFIGQRLVEGGGAGRSFLAGFLAAGEHELGRLRDAGAVRADADLWWATLQHFLLIWAPLTFRRALEDLLGAPLHEPPVLDAWARANVDLFERGLYRDG